MDNPSSIFQPVSLAPPVYARMRVYSTYIPMRDGVRLAADVYLPDPLPRGTRLPTLLQQARYWRATEMRPPLAWLLPREGDNLPMFRAEKRALTGRGYAVLVVDVRGSGASFGVWRYPWEAVSVSDAFDLVEWITRQPWSDGQVAGSGTSYMGTTAELLLACGHPAVKAVVAKFNHPDPFTDIACPGGLFNQRFVTAWGRLDQALDRNQPPDHFRGLMRLFVRGVRPVNGSRGRADLRAAIAMHADNGQLDHLPEGMTFRDQVHPQGGYSMQDLAPLAFREQLFSSPVPVLGWASWLDAGTAQAALRRLRSNAGPRLAVIGAWCHGGMKSASPFLSEDAPLDPPPAVQQAEMLHFLDTCLKHPDGAQSLENKVLYYTLGAETWQQSSRWPPAGFSTRTLYLRPNLSLTPQPPEQAGSLEYTVDWRASTGRYNRWWELGITERRSVNYGDRASQNGCVLAFESPPLERDLEICGTPVLSLYLASSEPDCAFYAYLEDVMPDGRILHLSEGQLRAIHHRLAPPGPYDDPDIPVHSFRQADAQPLTTGQVTEIRFALLPVSALLRRGHRLRLALAGHDQDNFPRIPSFGQPVWQIHCSPAHPSRLEIHTSA